MAVLLSGILVLVPLAIAPGFLFYFDVTPKVVTVLLGVGMGLPWMVLTSKEFFTTVSRTFLFLLGAFWISLIVSTLWSMDPWLSFGGTNWRRLGLISWTGVLLYTIACSAYLGGRPERIRKLLRVVCGSGIFVAVYGMLQFFGWDPWLPPDAYHVGEGTATIVRPPSTMGYATYFATYLLSVLFAGVAVWITDVIKVWRVIGAGAASLAAIVIVLSGTRGAILGIAAGGLLLAFWMRPRMRFRVLAAVFAIAAMFYYSPLAQKLRSRTRWYVEDPMGGPRLLLWRDSLRMTAVHWPMGMGLETFSTTFPQFQSAELARQFPDFYYESAHNVFLDISTAQGIPALLVFLLLIGWGLQSAWQEKPLARLFTASLAALLVAQQFSSFTLPTALFFFLNLALLISLRKKEQAAPGAKPLWFGLALLLGIPMSFFAVRLLIADRILAQTRSRVQVSEAIETYRQVQTWQPPGMNADLWYSRWLAVTAQKTTDLRTHLQAWQEAIQAARRATQRAEDRHNAWYNLAVLSAARNDVTATERSLRQAILFAPNWYKPHWTLAQLLQTQGQLEEAAAEAALAVDRNGGRHSEVSHTAAQIQGELALRRGKN